MRNNRNKRAFSLAEVVLAVSVMAVGMVFVAGVFPAAIHYTTSSVEKATAAIVADEAFAKIRLYGVNTAVAGVGIDFNDVTNGDPYNTGECRYPSDSSLVSAERQYCWSAVCTSEGVVTVFVSRLFGTNFQQYRDPGHPTDPAYRKDFPMPLKITVTATVDSDKAVISDTLEKTFISEGSYIVVNAIGSPVYRVIRRGKVDEDMNIILDRLWAGVTGNTEAWVVPPPVDGGMYPCISVFQKTINF